MKSSRVTVTTRWSSGSRRQPPALSVITVACNAGAALRQTLELAADDPAFQDGRVQWVVVNNGSEDETARVLATHRRRLPRLLTVIELARPIPADRALALGRSRAVGREILVRQPGESLACPAGATGFVPPDRPGARRLTT